MVQQPSSSNLFSAFRFRKVTLPNIQKTLNLNLSILLLVHREGKDLNIVSFFETHEMPIYSLQFWILPAQSTLDSCNAFWCVWDLS